MQWLKFRNFAYFPGQTNKFINLNKYISKLGSNAELLGALNYSLPLHIFFLFWVAVNIFRIHYALWFNTVKLGAFFCLSIMKLNIHFTKKNCIKNKIALSISQLNLSLSLRDRADTKTTFHHHRKLLRIFELTYTQVWYIFGIISSSPSYFCTENVGLIVVTIPFTKRCRNKSVYYERIDSSIWWYTDLSPHPLC